MLVVWLGAVSACSSPQTVSPPPPVPQPRPEVPAARPVPSPAVPPPAELRPDQLTGLSRDETMALLGPPTARSTRAMASVWTYRRGRCVLSLMFYPEVGTGIERVLSTEAEGGGTAETCLRRLREERLRHGQ
jgi:hypothetical protein